MEDDKTYFSFTNFVTPRRIYEIDLNDMSTEIFWEEKLDKYLPDDYVSEFKFFKSKFIAIHSFCTD